jgi:hypothetical protein
MRIVELLNNLSVPITNEEAGVLDKFATLSEVSKSDLDPREQLLANQLVNKEILTRKNNGHQIIYKKKIRS